MRRNRSELAALVALALIATVGLAAVADATHDRRLLVAALTGAVEVPGPGDPDGNGTSYIDIRSRTEVCFRYTVGEIAGATAAHIHAGAAGTAGPVVVPLLTPTTTVTGMTAEGCTPGVDPDLIRDLREDPSDYYVNVHNAEFPNGAIRGQLNDED
jgi:hypothetical protein